MKRKSVSRTTFFWYNISVCATDAGRDFFSSFPHSPFFQSLNYFWRCWSSFLGFRFAHCQQDMSNLLDWMEKPLFHESLGIVLAFWGMDYSEDCHSISGICRKVNPHCDGRCHSNAYPSHLNWSTFQTFPGWIQFLGVLYKRSTSLWSVLALIWNSGPKRTMRIVLCSVWLGPWCKHTWGPGFSPPEKWEGKWDGVCGTEEGYGAVKCCVPGLGSGKWFSPKDMEQLAACLLPSSSSEEPLESGCWL